MAADDGVVLANGVMIPRDELDVTATRSGGAGGQHVNTSSSRIELVWNISTSAVIDEETRAWLLERLATRLDKAGRLRLVSQDERSQLRNREAAMERLAEVVSAALVRPKKRRPTKPSRASKQARLDDKSRRSAIKKDRRTTSDD